MEIKNTSIRVDEFQSPEELSREESDLIRMAVTEAEKSYSPYSSFCVGVALRLANGLTYSANNQENAAYPSGMCAERVALYYAAAKHPEIPVDMMAIYAKTQEFELEKPVTPCGSCRQVMAETENRHQHKLKVLMAHTDGRVWKTEGMENLMPLMFMPEKLKKES